MFRKSGGFVIGAAVVLGLAWGGLKLWSEVNLSGYKPVPVKPGEINLVAVRRSAGYKIIVSNGTAHLAELSGNTAFDAPDTNEQAAAQNTPHLPIKETLKALQGDAKALGEMVMAVNDSKPDDFPSVFVVWTAEDIEKALNSDAELRKKLEHDLNTKLDGSPLETFNLDAILNGIVIDSPVTVKVPIEGKEQEIVCRIQEPYKTLFAGSVQKMIDEKFNPTTAAMLGFYRDKANEVLNTGRKEDVAGSLKARTSRDKLQTWATRPERILANMTVLISDNQMEGARFDSYPGPNRSILSDVTLKLTDDGRKRLWKYSHDNLGFQLLLTVNGVAIAAPKITTELAESEVKLTRIPSKELVEEAVNSINKLASGKKG